MVWLWLRSGFQSPGVTVRARDRGTIPVVISWLKRWALVASLFNASVSPTCKRWLQGRRPTFASGVGVTKASGSTSWVMDITERLGEMSGSFGLQGLSCLLGGLPVAVGLSITLSGHGFCSVLICLSLELTGGGGFVFIVVIYELLILQSFFIFISRALVFCLHVCLYACVRVSNTLKLDLQTVVSCHVKLGSEPGPSARAPSAPKH